jgi:hypothetical protein
MVAIEMADKDYGAKNELKEEDDRYFRYDKDNLSEVAKNTTDYSRSKSLDLIC